MQEIGSFLKSRQPVNLILIVINIIAFVVLSVTGDTEDTYFMFLHGANYTPAVLYEKEYYRVFSCMFLHFGLEHLFYNMLMLLFLGNTLERVLGKFRYLLIYLGGGIVGNIVSVIFEWMREDYSVSAGASGCIFSVIGALVGIVLLNRGRVEELMGRRLLLMAGLSIFQGFTASGINNCAHVGGFVSGILLALLFHKTLKRKEVIKILREEFQ